MRNDNITRLTLAGMFAALAFVCFTYLRIEIPMGGGMTGKIYIGHAFILLSALILGAKYGALTGAIGLSLADILAGYTTSAPPTFLAKFLLGLAVAFIAHKVFNLAAADDKKATKIVTIAAVFGCLVNVITEPLIRYGFKVFVLGLPHQIAYLSAINCAVSMAVSAVPSVILAVFLYKAVQHSILIDKEYEDVRLNLFNLTFTIPLKNEGRCLLKAAAFIFNNHCFILIYHLQQ